MSASRAAKLLRSVRPQGATGVERKRLARELLADLRRVDRDIATAKRRPSGTNLTRRQVRALHAPLALDDYRF
jgi:hypothetical protein